MDEYSNRSRLRYREKRKKTNIILNSLIAIVILLILVVGFSIFAGNDDAAPKNPDKTQAGQKAGSPDKNSGNNGESGGQDSTHGDGTDDKSQDDDESETDEDTGDEEGEPVITEGGSSPNVKRTIENQDWKPVGTSQTGDHQVVVDSSSPDWDEMHTALAYAIGTDKNNMTTWWLERDKSKEGGAIGTVTAKGSDQAYRVYIEWVDGEGYKPVKVEELYENDKK
ncbi:YrrS family protein [Neobacillus sp. SCS-31]|uniref:YrrS family protein n=1 Tax=Neobacillus oceani TaxID=3115292 RepID=UPI003905DA35